MIKNMPANPDDKVDALLDKRPGFSYDQAMKELGYVPEATSAELTADAITARMGEKAIKEEFVDQESAQARAVFAHWAGEKFFMIDWRGLSPAQQVVNAEGIAKANQVLADYREQRTAGER